MQFLLAIFLVHTKEKLAESLMDLNYRLSTVVVYQSVSRSLQIYPPKKDLLNKIFKGTDTSLATGFNILLLILSGPLALFGLNISNSNCLSPVVHTIFHNLFWHFISKADK